MSTTLITFFNGCSRKRLYELEKKNRKNWVFQRILITRDISYLVVVL